MMVLSPVPGAGALPLGLVRPRRVLMTLDAAGGVWRYALDLAAALAEDGYAMTFAGFGPRPTPDQRREAEAIGTLVWLDAPLDWMAGDESELATVPGLIADLAGAYEADLVHLNLPSQAAGLDLDVPVLVVSHSCVVTWFAAVRQSALPASWAWQQRLNRMGFDSADAVIAPSHAHAKALSRAYGPIEALTVVHNGSDRGREIGRKQPYVFAAGRWWDEGKNGAALDAAAATSPWPVLMAGPLDGANGERFSPRHAQALGPLAHGEVIAHMARAAIVASPSLYEPFGLAPLEAARCGAALVLADNPTYRELWDGAALFAPPHDPDAFGRAIAHLVAEPDLRAELAALAQQRATFFSLDRQHRAMSLVYEHLLTPGLARRSA